MAKKPKTETKMILEIAAIMAENEGPFTKRILAADLADKYPDKSYRELMNDISRAFLNDKDCNNRFKSVRVSVWDLKERVDKK